MSAGVLRHLKRPWGLCDKEALTKIFTLHVKPGYGQCAGVETQYDFRINIINMHP